MKQIRTTRSCHLFIGFLLAIISTCHIYGGCMDCYIDSKSTSTNKCKVGWITYDGVTSFDWNHSAPEHGLPQYYLTFNQVFNEGLHDYNTGYFVSGNSTSTFNIDRFLPIESVVKSIVSFSGNLTVSNGNGSCTATMTNPPLSEYAPDTGGVLWIGGQWDDCGYDPIQTQDDILLGVYYYGNTNASISSDGTYNLSDEYDDGLFMSDLVSLLPSYPTNWDSGSGMAYSTIDEKHTNGSLASFKYRFKLPPSTATNTTYLLNWDVVTESQYFGDTNILTSVDTNNYEYINGTGNPSNYVYGADHEIKAPSFYCNSTNGGTCKKYIANLTVSVLPPGGQPPGSGPGARGGPGGGEFSNGSCSGGCGGPPSGGAPPHDGGMQAQFGLGDTTFGRSSGVLRIWAATPSESLARPQNLSFIGNDANVDLIIESSVLRQVNASQTLADIVVLDDYSYEIRFYYPSQVGVLSNGLYPVTGNPFVTWKVENPNTTNSCNTVLLTETRGASSWIYRYIYEPTNNSWTTISPAGLFQQQMITSNNVAEGTRTLTQIIGPTNGDPAKVFTRTYHRYSWGEGVVSETDGLGSDAKTTAMTYYDELSSDGTFVPLESVVHPDGSWEYYPNWGYVLLPDGTHVNEYIYHGSGDDATPSSSSSRYTYYNYTPVDSSDDGSIEPHTARAVTEYVNYSPVACRYTIFSPGQKKEIQCTSSTDVNDSRNLVTTTKYYASGPNIFRVQSIQNPDGTMSFYDYASSTNSWQTNTVASGQPNGSQIAIENGTLTTTVLNALGHTVSVTANDVATGVTMQRDVYGDFDELDRAQQLAHLDGTTNYFNYACCYLESTVDRDGIATVYLHDAAKRQYGYQKFINSSNAITYQNSLDAAGRVFKTSRVGTTGSTITQSQISYDTAGDMVRQTNALDGVTSYSQSTNAETGGLIRTNTYADGGTRIETYYVDGSLKSVTGTAAHGKAYGYGAEYVSDINAYCSFTVETNLNVNGNLTSEWTKTYTDLAGRTVVVRTGDDYYDSNWQYHRPISCSFYNTKGQLWKRTDPDGVTTLYQYNFKGELSYTAVDLNQNDTLDFNGSDRITQTTNFVAITALGTNRVSGTYVWLDGQSTGTLVSRSETSVDGLKSWQVRYGEAGQGKPVTNSTVTSVSGSSRTSITTAPDGSYTISTYSYGRLLSSTRYDSTGAQIGGTSYVYDAHGRQYQVTDACNGTTTYGYNNADQVNLVAAPMGQTTLTYYDSLMRATNVVQPDNTSVSSAYLLTGELGWQSGSRTYPVAYSYDYAGRMKTMTNWSDFGSLTGGRVTTWNYDGQRGWLTNKAYADGQGPTYTYTAAGRLQSRSWVRLDENGNPITTTYAYDNAGSLTNIVYSDSTPSVTNTYDRLGRLTGVAWTNMVQANTYNLAGELLVESYTGGILDGLSITNGYDALLRRTKLMARASGSPLAAANYGYDNASRLLTVADDNNNSATYSYLANSPLVQQIAFKQGSTTRMTTTKSYDYLNRLTAITSQPSGTGVPPVSFNYAYNTANQRTKNVLADGSYWVYQYDTLGQATNGVKYFADGTLVPGQQFGYLFDDIGNRKQTQSGGDALGTGLRVANYFANNLNQITNRYVSGTNDITGVALATNSVTVNGQTAWRKGEYFWATVKSNNVASAQWEGTTVASGGTTNKGNLYVPKTPEVFQYDADGNLTNDGRWAYVWDAENRLVQMTVNTNVGPQYQLNFAYDPKSRRIQKQVISNSVSLYTNRFLYDGWNLVAELKPDNTRLLTYVWGTDLSGSMQGAGGVGGLLEVSYYGTSTTNCFPAFDGNGNVMALVNAANGTSLANYAYGPFGELIQQTGTMARNNPFRFSTKYQDDESDLLCYGYRYYKPSTGTWPSRDPIEEEGGYNLYGFCANDGIGNVDQFGLKVFVVRRPLTLMTKSWTGYFRSIGMGGGVLGGLPGVAGGLYLGQVANYYRDHTWHCILVIASKCEPSLDAQGHLVGLADVKPEDTWDFQADSSIHHPAADWEGGFKNQYYQGRLSITTIVNDDSKDTALKDFLKNEPTSQKYVLGGSKRYNCCDWVTKILNQIGNQYNADNPSPFGDAKVPSWVPDHLIGSLIDKTSN